MDEREDGYKGRTKKEVLMLIFGSFPVERAFATGDMKRGKCRLKICSPKKSVRI